MERRQSAARSPVWAGHANIRDSPCRETAYLGDLIPLLFPIGTREHSLMVLAAYFDESGTHRDSPVVAVGGFLSTAERWVTFEEEWRTVLRSNHLEYFHMTDFENRRGPYSGWLDKQREHVIKRLCGIINRSIIGGFSTAVVKDAYEVVDAQARSLLGTPYSFCAEWCLIMVYRQLTKARNKDRVAYFFESGCRGLERLLQQNQIDQWRAAHQVLSLSFGNKKDFLPLQAADILAYETTKQSVRHVGLDSRPRRLLMENLLRKNSYFGEMFRTADHIMSFVEDKRRVLEQYKAERGLSQ